MITYIIVIIIVFLFSCFQELPYITLLCKCKLHQAAQKWLLLGWILLMPCSPLPRMFLQLLLPLDKIKRVYMSDIHLINIDTCSHRHTDLILYSLNKETNWTISRAVLYVGLVNKLYSKSIYHWHFLYALHLHFVNAVSICGHSLVMGHLGITNAILMPTDQPNSAN